MVNLNFATAKSGIKKALRTRKVYLGVGSNLGNRQGNIKKAARLLGENGNIQVVRRSSFYETEPVGYKKQPDFLNCIFEIKTSLTPLVLLKVLKNIEKKLKRVKNIKWGPRLIDLDILLYGNKVIEKTNLTIPHPEMHKRRFILAPLAEIAPEIIHPLKKKTILELYKNLSDKHKVRKLKI
jgi:2-amino-4-hydroxy-6-hydroxymethyldihydropteridine diphosphokinase